MKRNSEGKVIDSLWTRFKNWWLGRKIRAGTAPHGRTDISGIPSRDDKELSLLRTKKTQIVVWKNSGVPDEEICRRFDCRLGNLQSVLRALKSEGRLA